MKREEQERALELRKAGASYQQIADQLGCSLSTAWTAVRRAIERHTSQAGLHNEDWRRIELERIDKAILGIAPKVTAGDTKAIDRMLMLQKQRERYLPGSGGSKGSRGLIREALEETIATLPTAKEPALLQMARSMADALDLDPGNAQMWRTYRETVLDLIGEPDHAASANDDPISQVRSGASLGHLQAV